MAKGKVYRRPFLGKSAAPKTALPANDGWAMSETPSRLVEVGEYAVLVYQANNLMGQHRQAYRMAGKLDLEAQEAAGNDQTLDLGVRSSRTIFYPDSWAVSKPIKGFDHWPITFGEYLSLPDDFTSQWQDMVYEMNPTWAWWDKLSEEEMSEVKKNLLTNYTTA